VADPGDAGAPTAGCACGVGAVTTVGTVGRGVSSTSSPPEHPESAPSITPSMSSSIPFRHAGSSADGTLSTANF
jgi:hypothetical protein